jgi:glycosyltransferase involved in cell wall biosynthesis
MRILFVVKNYYPSIGGTQLLFQQLAESCANLYNDEVTLYTIDSIYGSDKTIYKAISRKAEVINGVKVIRFSYWRFHLRPFIFISKLLRRIGFSIPDWMRGAMAGPISFSMKKAMCTTDADVIVGSSSGYWFMRYPLWAEKLHRPKPFLFHGAIHFSLDEASFDVAETSLKAIKKCSRYLANSPYEIDRLTRENVPSNKIALLGCTVVLNDFEKGDRNYYRSFWQLTDHDIVIGYVGRLSPLKGLDVLCEAMKLVWQKYPKAHLVLAGHDNGYISKLEEFKKTLPSGQAEQLKILPDLSDTQKINLFHSFDIFTLPSVNESFGIVFLEAWACKKPVIGAGIGAVASIIEDGHNGLLAKPNSPSDLSEKIKMLIENPKLAENLALRGFEKAANYDITTVVEKFRQICYQEINKL